MLFIQWRKEIKILETRLETKYFICTYYNTTRFPLCAVLQLHNELVAQGEIDA